MSTQATDPAGGFHGAFRQSMSWLHTWVGLVLSIVLYFMFVTGTTGYARVEINHWMRPEEGKVTPADAGGPARPVADQAEALMRMAEARSPGYSDGYMYFSQGGRGERAYGSIYVVPAAAPEGEAAQEEFEVRIDPRTLEPFPSETRETGGGDALYAMHFDLHYIPFIQWTFWGYTTPALPTLIVGVATLFMLVALVTGIVVHKKVFADFFTFRPAKGQRSWLDAHNLSSVLALPFMVMITYSGLLFYAYDYMPTVKLSAYGTGDEAQARFDCEVWMYGCANLAMTEGAAADAPAAGEGAAEVPRGGTGMASVRAMIERADEVYAGYGAETGWVYVYPGNPDADDVEIYARVEGYMGAGGPPALAFSEATGALETSLDAATPSDNPLQLASDVLTTMHMGDYAGRMLRWLYLASGAIGAAMVATGLVLWSTKRRQKLRAAETADLGLEFVARTNVGIVVGLPAAVAVYFLANRLLPVGMEGRAAWELHCLFIAWGLAFLHAAVRPTKRAWVEQFSAAAGIFLAIPLVNALTTDVHLGRTLFVPVAERDWVLASVDLTMLGLAAAFTLAALGADRSARKAPAADRAARRRPAAGEGVVLEPAE